jgi:DUF4097 and DUF4098 domain-containing protein YvlB
MAMFTVIASTLACADDWDKTFTVSAAPQVRLDTKDGDVEIRAWDQKQVHVHIYTVGYRIGPSALRVEDNQSGDNVEVNLRVPSRVCFFFCHTSIRVSVQVPRQSNLDIRTGDGDVTGSEIHGDLHIRTGDGNVTLNQIDGKLVAETGDGNVRVNGRLDALSIHTGDGNVGAGMDQGSKTGESWSIRSGDGSVHLWVPQDFSADLELRTGDGDITLSVPVEVSGSLSKSHVHGRLNQGGLPLEVHTGDGNIEVGRR